jgi:hypothetical protein
MHVGQASHRRKGKDGSASLLLPTHIGSGEQLAGIWHGSTAPSLPVALGSMLVAAWGLGRRCAVQILSTEALTLSDSSPQEDPVQLCVNHGVIAPAAGRSHSRASGGRSAQVILRSEGMQLAMASATTTA